MRPRNWLLYIQILIFKPAVSSSQTLAVIRSMSATTVSAWRGHPLTLEVRCLVVLDHNCSSLVLRINSWLWDQWQNL